MSRSSREERIHTLTEKAMNAYARARAARERRRGQPPRPGDLFVLAESADFPVEWAVLGRDPETPGRLLAVAADCNPLVGSADVAVPAGAATGPLSLRCAVAVRLDVERLEAARRTGSLEPEHLDRARRKRTQIEAGTLAGSILEQEADGEPEYEDWMEEVLEKAQATLLETPRRSGEAEVEPETAAGAGGLSRFRRPAVRRFFANPYALAASILLAATLGFLGGVAWHDRHEPLVNLPLAWLGPAGTVRGQVETLTLPPEASHFLVLLEVNARYPSYRLEIREMGTDASVWTSAALTKVGETELSVALPRRSFPAGEYRLRLHGLSEGRADLLDEYALRIAEE